MKNRVIIFLVIFIIIISGTFYYKINKGKSINNIDTEIDNNTEEYIQKSADGSKINISKELNKNKTIDELEINNITLKEKNGITTLLADVNNTTDSKIKQKKIKIEILDKNKSVITELIGIIDAIEPKGTVQLNMSITADVANAYDFKVSMCN